MEEAVTLQELVKAFGEHRAVDGLSMQVPLGRVFGLIGPNGAGKTTTIRMIMDIIRPDSGEVRILGSAAANGAKQHIGYLPEERGLYKKMKVRELLVFLAEVRGVSAAEAGRRAQQWCERLQIAEWLPKKVEELSKGMQQKIQFIAALLHEPELILMDEPFAGLDPVNTSLLKDVMVELKQQGRTILFSTHRMDQVEKLCDAICLVNHGRPVLEGNLREIKARYGKNQVHIAYEGDGDFLGQSPLVASANDYGNYVEVQLKPGADAQELLRQAAARARVTRFELAEPSLEQIFIDVVGDRNVAA
jgi:ABC-2 type transport system ATP-binding protein